MKNHKKYLAVLLPFIACLTLLARHDYIHERPDKNFPASYTDREDATCSHHYRISYFTNSDPSRYLGENKDVWKFLDEAATQCGRQSTCLWELEVFEDGKVLIHCIQSDH